MEEKLLRLRELTNKLDEAAKAYYQEDREIISNYEYDKLYDELVILEKELGISLSNSPTGKVGYKILSELPKREHDSRMLSLDKTKSIDELENWLGNKEGVLSWKLDGLTIVLRYENGELFEAVTRGNGAIGELVTENAKAFVNVPLKIPYKGSLLLRGEAVISYSDFEKINEKIEDEAQKYKNPRNLCSGSVRQLNPNITKERNVRFFAFSLVSARDVDFLNSRMNQFDYLKGLGFDVVEHYKVNSENIREKIKDFEKKIETYDIPSDGLVLILEDIAYGESLGQTAKFPRNAIAFKWKDEIKETTLKEIEWSPSRTGLINPVAIFEPVELEGTTVSRASVHNISILYNLELGVGDTISVYKANMIIPQIADNLTRSGNINIPKSCPACDGDTQIKDENGIKTLYCINPDCPAKHIKGFELATSRDALNIDGLSKMTLEKFIEKGFIKELADIYKLEKYKDIITSMDGFGEKSYNKIIDSINKSRKTTMPRLIYSLGITGIGSANAGLLAKFYKYNIIDFMNAKEDDLLQVDGIGEVLARQIVTYLANENNISKLNNLLKEVELEQMQDNAELILENLNFAITGSLETFENRSALKNLIEENGGKVVSSVGSKTNYLINNDKLSSSSKNKKAKELGIPIISEQDFLDLFKIGR